MIRYKVVSGGINFHSYYCYDAMNIYYPLNVKANKVKGSAGIFVLDTKENAIKFMLEADSYSFINGRDTILKVEAHGRGIRLDIRPTNYDKDNLKRFGKLVKEMRWRKVLSSGDRSMLREMPSDIIFGLSLSRRCDGTMLYQSVTPVEDIFADYDEDMRRKVWESM